MEEARRMGYYKVESLDFSGDAEAIEEAAKEG